MLSWIAHKVGMWYQTSPLLVTRRRENELTISKWLINYDNISQSPCARWACWGSFLYTCLYICYNANDSLSNPNNRRAYKESCSENPSNENLRRFAYRFNITESNVLPLCATRHDCEYYPFIWLKSSRSFIELGAFYTI